MTFWNETKKTIIKTHFPHSLDGSLSLKQPPSTYLGLCSGSSGDLKLKIKLLTELMNEPAAPPNVRQCFYGFRCVFIKRDHNDYCYYYYRYRGKQAWGWISSSSNPRKPISTIAGTNEQTNIKDRFLVVRLSGWPMSETTHMISCKIFIEIPLENLKLLLLPIINANFVVVFAINGKARESEWRWS